MKVRTVLCADEGTVLTNGVNYGAMIWLADNASVDDYYAIAQEEYDKILAELSGVEQTNNDRCDESVQSID